MQEIPGAVEDFSRYLSEHGKREATVESYGRDARQFHAYLDSQEIGVDAVTPETLTQYEDYLRNQRSSRVNSVRRQLIGVRMYFRFLAERRRLAESPCEFMIIPKRKDDLPKGLAEQDIGKLMAEALGQSSRLKASRDCAILALLAWEGLKANEIIGLEWRNLLSSGTGMSLSVGGVRPRVIEVHEKTCEYLDAYRDAFDVYSGGRADRNRHMFVAFQGRDGAVVMDHMTRHGLKFVLYELGERVGLKHLNTELLRHFSVTFMLGCGWTTDHVMLHLGLRRGGVVARHSLSQRRAAPVPLK